MIITRLYAGDDGETTPTFACTPRCIGTRESHTQTTTKKIVATTVKVIATRKGAYMIAKAIPPNTIATA